MPYPWIVMPCPFIGPFAGMPFPFIGTPSLFHKTQMPPGTYPKQPCNTVFDSKRLSMIKQQHLVSELDAAPFAIILFSPLLVPYIGAILGPLVGPLVGPPHGGPPLTPLLLPLIPLYTTFHMLLVHDAGCNNYVTKPGPSLTPFLLPFTPL